MIDHTGIGVAHVGRSAAFYDAALGALGLRRVIQLPENDGADGVGYGAEHPIFWIDRFHPHSVKQHTAFAAKSRAQVDAFYAAALNNPITSLCLSITKFLALRDANPRK